MKKIITASILTIATMVSANPTMANGKQWHNCNININNRKHVTCDEGHLYVDIETHSISGSRDDVSQGLYSFVTSIWVDWNDKEVYREVVLSISRDTSDWTKEDYRGVFRYRFNDRGPMYQSRSANKQLYSVTEGYLCPMTCWQDDCYFKYVK